MMDIVGATVIGGTSCSVARVKSWTFFGVVFFVLLKTP